MEEFNPFMKSETMIEYPVIEKHLLQCCVCKMYQEMDHIDFLEFSNDLNEDLSNFVCTECVFKSSLIQQIDVLTKEINELQSQLRNYELTSMEKSFDQSVREIAENLARQSDKQCDYSSEENANPLLEQQWIEINDSVSTNDQVLDEEPKEFPRMVNSGSAPHLRENDIVSTTNNNKQINNRLLNRQEEQFDTVKQSESEMLKTKVLLIGDSQLKYVNVGEYQKHDKSILKVVHPNMKITQTGKTAEYLTTKLHKNISTVIAHVGANDVKNRRSLKMFEDFQRFSDSMKSLGKTLIISGPLPTTSCNSETFSRLYDLNLWLSDWCQRKGIIYIENFNLFWKNVTCLITLGIN